MYSNTKTNGDIDVMSAPSEHGAVVEQLPQNTPVAVLMRDNGWCMIEYAHIGYVREEDLKKEWG